MKIIRFESSVQDNTFFHAVNADHIVDVSLRQHPDGNRTTLTLSNGDYYEITKAEGIRIVTELETL